MSTSEMPAGSTFACRHCQSYTPEGRRGGHCQLLNVAVQGGWGACSLGMRSFTPRVEQLPQPVRWPEMTHPQRVESASHEVVSSMVFPSPTIRRDPLPAGMTRLQETLADPSAA